MARPLEPHPLGKCEESRLEISMPKQLRLRLNAIATIHGKAATTWARDVLERAIEGEWVFMQRRVVGPRTNGQQEQPPEEHPDA